MMTIPFIDLKHQYQILEQEIQARINKVLEHGQYIMGPEVRELEERLQNYTGAAHCVTVSSGTEALLISLMALGIGAGDEVITTPFTFVATAEVIVLLGAKPVFVDIQAHSYNIDPLKIESAITPRTKAIIPVSLYGQPADMEEINAIAARHGCIPVIEDAAQSLGAEYRHKKSTNLSTMGCTSFFPSKPLGCYGDGGAIFTNDADLAQACREIRVHGQSRRYVHSRIGVGGRMDTLQCAIVLAKLEKFDLEITRRQEAASRYSAMIRENCRQIEPPTVAADRSSVFAQYTLRTANRDALQAHLKAAGIPTAIHYPVPLNEQPAYQHLAVGAATPVAHRAATEVLSLPMHPWLEDEVQRRIINALSEGERLVT